MKVVDAKLFRTEIKEGRYCIEGSVQLYGQDKQIPECFIIYLYNEKLNKVYSKKSFNTPEEFMKKWEDIKQSTFLPNTVMTKVFEEIRKELVCLVPKVDPVK